MASDHYNRKATRIPFITKWILPLFLKPKKTTAEIVDDIRNVWLTPLVIVSVLAILAVLISAPIRREAIQMGTNLPPDFQYYSQEQQQQFYEGQASQTSPLFLYVFPVLAGLFKLWISWFLLSILLYLTLTLFGSRTPSLKSYNLVAWSFLPLAVRYIVQIVAMLFTHTQVTNAGLSGFVNADATGFIAYLGALLGLIDIYFIFQVILLFLGAVPLSGLTKNKALAATGISILLLILLQAVPGLLSKVLGGISVTRPFFF
jgi:hypothetical protein